MLLVRWEGNEVIKAVRFKTSWGNYVTRLITGQWRLPAKGIVIAILSLFVSCVLLSTDGEAQTPHDPALVLQAYVRATYARDFVEAYRFISTADRKVRDLNRYIQQRGPFAGFTLEVARKLSESVEIKLVGRLESAGHMETTVKYKVPDPKSLAPLLLNWDANRLNSLAPAERKTILDAIDRLKREGSFDMSEGEETIQLVKENEEWRVYLNWAAGVKIPLRLDLSKSDDLEVSLSKDEVVIEPGELFEIVLKIRNRTSEPVTTRIGHLVEPSGIADYLDFVQCGFLVPVTIAPAREEQFSGTYLLRGSLPEGVRQLNLTYDFSLLK